MPVSLTRVSDSEGVGSPWETARLQHTTPHVFDAAFEMGMTRVGGATGLPSR